MDGCPAISADQKRAIAKTDGNPSPFFPDSAHSRAAPGDGGANSRTRVQTTVATGGKARGDSARRTRHNSPCPVPLLPPAGAARGDPRCFSRTCTTWWSAPVLGRSGSTWTSPCLRIAYFSASPFFSLAPPASGVSRAGQTTGKGRTWRCREGPRRCAHSPESERATVEIPGGGASMSVPASW